MDFECYLQRLLSEEAVAEGVRLPALDLRRDVDDGDEPEFSFNFAGMIYHSSSKKLKTNTCPHPDRKHYAKNMCSACYHKTSRPTRAWKCVHSDLPHYAKGRCHDCYLNKYYKRRVPVIHPRPAMKAVGDKD